VSVLFGRFVVCMVKSIYCIESTLKMVATYPSETSVENQWITSHYIVEDRYFHNHHCENLIFYTEITCRFPLLLQVNTWNMTLTMFVHVDEKRKHICISNVPMLMLGIFEVMNSNFLLRGLKKSSSRPGFEHWTSLIESHMFVMCPSLVFSRYVSHQFPGFSQSSEILRLRLNYPVLWLIACECWNDILIM
jgi:hypothetical protein